MDGILRQSAILLVCGVGDYETGQYEEDNDGFAAIMSKDRIGFHELKARGMEHAIQSTPQEIEQDLNREKRVYSSLTNLDFCRVSILSVRPLMRSAERGAPAAPSPKRCCNSMDTQGKSVVMITKQVLVICSITWPGRRGCGLAVVFQNHIS